MTFAFGETVTRLRAATSTDPYSNAPVPDWNLSPVLSTDFVGWGVDDSQSIEPLEDGREPVLTDFVLYRDEPADVLPGDRVVVRGFTAEVVGRPGTWRHPLTGWAAGFVVKARLVEPALVVDESESSSASSSSSSSSSS